MSMSDPLGDMLTRIRNAQARKLTSVTSPASNLRASVLDVLVKEGYIRSYERQEVSAGISELRIELKYHEGEPVIRTIKRVSKPGRRVYSKIKDLTRPFNGLGIAVLSTPRGVMSDIDAREANVGGEVLCQLF
jgi:small subunit ribosomal protein S8